MCIYSRNCPSSRIRNQPTLQNFPHFRGFQGKVTACIFHNSSYFVHHKVMNFSIIGQIKSGNYMTAYKHCFHNLHVIFTLYRNTSCNEVFNSIIGAYVPKRLTYRPPGYRARCLLAAIDYQANHDRPVATTEEGEVR